MAQKDLRTYQRRSVTRKSGFHTCDETTGGECLIVKAQRYLSEEESVTFSFYRESISAPLIFGKNEGILAFGGYIFLHKPAEILCELKYDFRGSTYTKRFNFSVGLLQGEWNCIGFHHKIELIEEDETVSNALVKLQISAEQGVDAEFVSFDFDAISKSEFSNSEIEEKFLQKTAMHIPHLYYLDAELSFEAYQISPPSFIEGQDVVRKSCNRCGRYLPINITHETNTIAFSLHCKKKAPCVHSTFRAYKIQNAIEDANGIRIEGGSVVSYYGHQLECKACKKFFVNAPLNPQRNAQQFKEDGLRRRALEVLVNKLLHRNLIHFEFERKTKKQFSEYIWEKFDKKCFKCGKLLASANDMNLDHTRPIAYLYRLDESATCLCENCNSRKRDHFPSEFYNKEEIEKLSEVTGLSVELLLSKKINKEVLDLLVKEVVWFYDDFLMKVDYQKIRDGILTSDKINDSLKRVIQGAVDLAEAYKKIKGHYPSSITTD